MNLTGVCTVQQLQFFKFLLESMKNHQRHTLGNNTCFNMVYSYLIVERNSGVLVPPPQKILIKIIYCKLNHIHTTNCEFVETAKSFGIMVKYTIWSINHLKRNRTTIKHSPIPIVDTHFHCYVFSFSVSFNINTNTYRALCILSQKHSLFLEYIGYNQYWL